MDLAKLHWKILRCLRADLVNRVRSFMVVGWDGKGVLVATENGEGYWFGKIRFGSDETKSTIEPTLLNVSGLVQMAQSDSHILLLTESGQIYAMGKNNRGQLGLGSVDQETHFTPQLISIPHKFSSVRCGNEQSLALTEDGKVWAWGRNCNCHVGVPDSAESFLSPHQISELDSYRVVAVECGGGSHWLVLTDQGDVYGWRGNNMGQLRDGSRSFTHTAIQIPTPSPVKSIASGDSHTLMLTQTGEVYVCKWNGRGQLSFPTGNQSSPYMSKVAGLPLISQIASHPIAGLSIAMSFDHRCFIWGRLRDETFISTPRELPPFYSTVESPISFFSIYRSTPHSVQVPEILPNRLTARMSRMFDDPETSDVKFVVEQRTIHAHRIILSYSSDYFNRMFSERWLPQVDPEDPIVKVTIPDHSYEVFHIFLRFLYTDSLKAHSNHIPELFELASQYLESDLQQLCFRHMRANLTSTTCCLFYQLTNRHSLPELDAFQQELVQFASTRMPEITDSVAYQSMEPDLRDKLTNAVGNLLGT